MNWVAEYCGVKPKVSLIKRRLAKLQFVALHKFLCKEAFDIGTDHKDYKSIPGSKLIELTRKELVYRDSTYSGDIYFGLLKLH